MSLLETRCDTRAERDFYRRKRLETLTEYFNKYSDPLVSDHADAFAALVMDAEYEAAFPEPVPDDAPPKAEPEPEPDSRGYMPADSREGLELRCERLEKELAARIQVRDTVSWRDHDDIAVDDNPDGPRLRGVVMSMFWQEGECRVRALVKNKQGFSLNLPLSALRKEVPA